MISNVHYIELYIDNQLMELESQESLHMRLNNVLFNPTRTSTKQAEYSFSFDIPSTPNNDKVLGYANNLSKTNKFHARYPSQVYSDGTLIFDGSLTVQKYDAKDKMYSCNLVNIKINTLSDIFGDDVLTDMKWYVDYDGCSTMEEVNKDPNTKYWFPLVLYGVPPKTPISYDFTNPEFNKYSSIYEFDGSEDWRLADFYPSLNLLETVKRCFENKGYTVGGDAFGDPILKEIYTSTNLAKEQDPEFNVGNPKFGKVSLDVSWSNDGNPSYYKDNVLTYYTHDLKFPYMPAEQAMFNLLTWETEEIKHWNFNEVLIDPIFNNAEVNFALPYGQTSGECPSMYEENIIVIPADGFYKITMTGDATLTQQNAIEADQWVHDWNDRITAMTISAHSETIKINPDFRLTMPLEIQLVKNYDDNLELIKGKYNFYLHDGYPDHETECNQGRLSNWFNYITCFPHEKTGYDMTTKDEQISDADTLWLGGDMGYVYPYGTPMCYDPVVSDIFIAGMTTMGNKEGYGTTAFIKNGYSWSTTYADKNESFFEVQPGYNHRWHDSTWTIHEETSTFNANNLPNIPNNYFYQVGNNVNFQIYGMVKLKKGDRLQLMAVRRGYRKGTDLVPYGVTANIHLEIEAATPKSYYTVQANGFGWNSNTDFPTQLNLFNFTNNEKKVSEWIQNVADAFNLTISSNGNEIDISKNQGIKKTNTFAVDIDDRVNSSEVESEYISYPKEMSVKFKIDEKEHGFVDSVPQEHINEDDWKNWGESGYTIIKLSDDTYETQSQNKQLQFSYCWYDSRFKYTGKNTAITVTTYTIPVIAEDGNFIDGYNYPEMMKEDGYSLAQRFFFRDYTYNPNTYRIYVKNDRTIVKSSTPLATYTKIEYQYFHAAIPIPQLDGFNLSYKDTEKSIASEYFNIYPMLSSNYVNVECFLNPIEYINIKNGALVHFDSDLYYTSEISGYDPSGGNRTKLKLIKKV